MIFRIELSPLDNWRDAKAESVKKQITDILKLPVKNVKTREVYTVSADITEQQIQKVADELKNPIIQNVKIGISPVSGFDWLIIVGFLPGVTDNIGRTATLAVGDIIGRKLNQKREKVFSSTEYFLYAPELKKNEIESIGKNLLANEYFLEDQVSTDFSKHELFMSLCKVRNISDETAAIAAALDIHFRQKDHRPSKMGYRSGKNENVWGSAHRKSIMTNRNL